MKTKDLTITAMMIAITVLLAIIPNLGIIQLGPISFTIMHITVIISAFCFKKSTTIITALAFGFSSMFVAVTRGATPLDLLFVNPLVSVLPRFLFGLFTILLVDIFNRTNIHANVKISIVGFISTLLHTIITLTAAFIAMDPNFNFSGLYNFLYPIIATNGVVEAIASVSISIPVVFALRRITK